VEEETYYMRESGTKIIQQEVGELVYSRLTVKKLTADGS
jgi:hypothetical protein